MLVGALGARAAVLRTVALLAFPLLDLPLLLSLRQRIEPVGRETEGLRYSKVSLVLGE